MLGNVWEWTGTTGGWENDLTNGVLPDDYKGPNPTGAAAGMRYLQGGSWAGYEEQAKYYGAAYFDCYSRNGTGDNVGTQGFRVCLTIPNAAQ